MLRCNPLLPVVEKALGTPCGFSEDRRKIYFAVDDTVENVRNVIQETCKKEDLDVDISASFYILPLGESTMVQLEN